MKIKLIAFFILCCWLISCTTYIAPVSRQIQNSFTFDKPFEIVWQSVIEVFAKLNLSIMNMEKASGLITTDWISFGSRDNITGYCSCGKLINEENKNVLVGDRRGRFNVYVKKVSDSSCELMVNAVFELANINGPLHCESTGKLEAEIYKGVSAIIK